MRRNEAPHSEQADGLTSVGYHHLDHHPAFKMARPVTAPFEREGLTMANRKAKSRQRETIACCRPCGRTHIMTGSVAQLKREGALHCPRCKQALDVVMEVERL